LDAYQNVIGITLPSAAIDAKIQEDCTGKLAVLEKAKLGPLSGRHYSVIFPDTDPAPRDQYSDLAFATKSNITVVIFFK
jgi:hypothetical protein